MNEGHLQELMLEHAVPPPAPPGSSSVSLVRMGFPPRNPEAPGAAAFCGAGSHGGGHIKREKEESAQWRGSGDWGWPMLRLSTACTRGHPSEAS